MKLRVIQYCLYQYFLERNMERKGGKIVSFVSFILVALTFMRCCIAIADTELDPDLKVDLVADEVKARKSIGKETKKDKPGKYLNAFLE